MLFLSLILDLLLAAGMGIGDISAQSFHHGGCASGPTGHTVHGHVVSPEHHGEHGHDVGPSGHEPVPPGHSAGGNGAG